MSIGFFENYTHRLRRDYDKPSADLAFDIARSLRPDYQLHDFIEPLRYPTERRQDVHEILSLLEPGTRTLSVHMDTYAYKTWDETRWVESLDEFLDKHPNFVVLLVGRPQHPVDTEQWRNAGRVIPCYGLVTIFVLLLSGRIGFFHRHRFVHAARRRHGARSWCGFVWPN